jgi:hypothetical protein
MRNNLKNFYKKVINMGKRKEFNSNVEVLDALEDYEEGFIEGDITSDRAIATFSFGMSNKEENHKTIEKNQPITNKTGGLFTFNDIANTASSKGITPAIDGELFTIKRGYQFRPSTLRKLTEIKARHSDVNVYLNTIIDEAILYYYDYLFNSDNN